MEIDFGISFAEAVQSFPFHWNEPGRFLAQALILVGVPYYTWQIKAVRRYTPLVVLQIFTGVILGPSIFGEFFPEAFDVIFPKESLGGLTVLNWAALIFFGFLTGQELHPEEIAKRGKSFAAISLASILLPFAVCFGAGWWIVEAYPQVAGEKGDLFTLVFSLAVMLSVTALPVLSATLIDMKLSYKPIGKMALGCATVNDAILWVLVAIVLVLTQGGSFSDGGALKILATLTALVLYLLFMFRFIKPRLEDGVRRGRFDRELHNGQLARIIMGLVASSAATELIGMHFLLGAFVFGLTIPKSIRHAIHAKLDPLVSVWLLPFFFMSTGLKTQFDVFSIDVFVLCFAMSILSSLTKIFGTAVTARLCGESWEDALKLGALMQCKGLMEVVVATMIRGALIISYFGFSAVILMALLTTVVTKPMYRGIDWVFSQRAQKKFPKTRNMSSSPEQEIL